MKTLQVLVALFVAATASAARADCFDSAASYHGVNPWVLRAIAFKESSFRAGAVHRNSNNTIDIGEMGTNSVHFAELAKYGIRPDHLFDSCTSIYVAGWRLKKKMKRHGNTWAAVGAYHSETAYLRDEYARQIKQIIDGWATSGAIR